MALLVVDDDEEVREVMAETLSELGYGVLQAGCGEQALTMIEANPEINLVITDVRMPGISGLDLIAAVRKKFAPIQFILISGYFLPQEVDQPFLRKPFKLLELVQAVRAALGE